MAVAQPAMADWPVYGHDLANTRSAGTEGPSTVEAASLPKAWTFTSSKGDFTGTPVVAGGVLVAGSNMGTVYALDAKTGKQLWSRDTGPDQISASAAIDLLAPGGPTVFVPIGKEGDPKLLALWLRDGSVRWEAHLSQQDPSTNPDVYGSPTFSNGTVYLGTSGPNFDDSTARGSVVAVNEASGKLRWITYTVPPGHDGGAVWATPSIDGAGRLWIGTGNAYHDPAADTTDSIMALDSRNGRVLGHYQAVADDVFKANENPVGPDADFGASVNLITDPKGRQLAGAGNKNGKYYALDPSTMKPAWTNQVGPGSSAGGVVGSTAHDGTHIFGSIVIDSQVWGIGDDGSPAWNSADLGTFDFSPLAVANGVLYTSDFAGFLTARDAATGTILNKLPLGSPNFGGMSVVGKAVYVAVGTGPINAQPGGPGNSSGTIAAYGDTTRGG
jgi:polyvinyl alcohol dehydrogenase (cytochrome)